MEKRQIPNILSAIRLLAVPVFVAVFFSDIANANIWALVIFVAAELTDILDGYLARRNGWITDVGKILDPLADKLMQAAAIISLAVKQPVLIWLTVLFAVKETCMLIGAYLILKKRKDIVVSSWYGKAASAIFACTVTALLLLWENYVVTLTLSILLGIVILFAFTMYYIKIFRGKYGLKKPNPSAKHTKGRTE
ncbi:MAG TPA: CDP-alcohol phosphatidyltransferase family protein [Firmicutes bacterium]|nr:CDP-alcohol phosphatidyltransferase family protein [Bacillota bacterium]